MTGCGDAGLLLDFWGSQSVWSPVQSHPRASFSSLPQVFTKYGKCYMFNSGEDGKPLLTTVKGGTGNGLEIMLDIQQDEYLPIWGETGEPGQGPGQGVRAEGIGAGKPLPGAGYLGPPGEGLLSIKGRVICR